MVRQKYVRKRAAARHGSLAQRFCTALIDVRADFAIDGFSDPLFDPAATSAPVAAAPPPQGECTKVQYQCNYLHRCSIFSIRAIEARADGVLVLLFRGMPWACIRTLP